MADRTPSQDLRDGLFLLFKAARGLSKQANTESLERAVQVGAKEVVRAINNVGRVMGEELSKAVGDEPKAQATDAKDPHHAEETNAGSEAKPGEPASDPSDDAKKPGAPSI